MFNRSLGILFCFLFISLNPVWGAIPAKKIETANGITVLLVETHSLPMVQVDLLVRAGSILDSEPKAGLAYLTASLLEEGTKNRSSKQIADEWDALGTEFNASPGSDYVTFSSKLLKKDLEKGLTLFSDILINPQFPEEEVSREKTELLGHLDNEKDDPETIAAKAFDRAIFGKHPYHQPLEGDEETIKRITREDIVRFYQTAYNPRGAILAFVGDLTEEEAKTYAEKYFRLWNPKPQIHSKNPLPPKIDKKEIMVIDKDLTQTSIILGHTGIPRMNPDYYSLLVMNYILGGGGFSSRMMTNIRDNKGLVYGLFSHFDSRLETGSFEVTLQTKNSSANEAISEVLNEIRKMRNEPVSPVELQEAKDYLIGSFPLKMDTHAKLAGILIYQEFYGLGLDYFDKYAQRIKKVTAEEVQRVARQYLDPDRFVLVAIGKQSEAKIGVNQSISIQKEKTKQP
ncbi:MAG: insulinase family protein [Nitrospirae bacterium]|nr:insulinase family protein [Nitrospirota bacterium]MBI3352085.1 insulinase family protein [Nitrospirota bacterium]